MGGLLSYYNNYSVMRAGGQLTSEQNSKFVNFETIRLSQKKSSAL